MNKNFLLKDCDVSIKDFYIINPMLGMIFYAFVQYAKENNLPVVVTSMIDTPEQSRLLGRKSTTHEDARAIDISAREWPDLHCHRVASKLNVLFANRYGTAPVGKHPRVVVYHDAGHGSHFHLQVRKNIVEFID